MSSYLKENLPSELVTHVTAICGRRGEVWFDELPELISRLGQQWSIEVGEPFPGIEFNFVAEATRSDGTPVVLKIAPPFETTEIHAEAKFLRTRNGNGAVRLLSEDREAKAILIERALPGKSLVDLFAHDPLASIPPAIEILHTITIDPPQDMTDVPTLDTWFANFRHRYPGTRFPVADAERAIELYGELAGEKRALRYIHGDFHLGNVVSSDRNRFLAIDPKGIVGHVGYEAAVFLINIYNWQTEKDGNVLGLLAEAVRLFADGLQLSEETIRRWGFVHTIIGAWWSCEDMPELYDPELAMPDIWDV